MLAARPTVGRPRNGDAMDKRVSQVAVWMSPEEKLELFELADAEGRTLSTYVCRLLRAHLDAIRDHRQEESQPRSVVLRVATPPDAA
jgi:predicted DNA-binding protein